MTRSDALDSLATALATAQAAIVPAKKDSENPHFRSRYADLAAIWDACRAALSTAGLSVIQSPRLVAVGDLWAIELETMLLHNSGQWVADTLTLPVATSTAQAVGSAITYGRRYALASFVGVAPDDDDGHAATARRPAARVNTSTGELLEAAADDRPAPRPPVESVTVKVLGIVKRKTGTGHKFVITGDDQATYHTFSESQATAAKVALEAGLPVEIVFTDSEYGRQVQVVREPDTTEAVI